MEIVPDTADRLDPHDPPSRDGLALSAPADRPLSLDEEHEIEEHLRSLGYIE